MSTFVLKGLDGGNPLGFLAALGVLRTSALGVGPTTAMHWVHAEGGWRPWVTLPGKIDAETWVADLHATLKTMDEHPALTLGNNLNLPCGEFRDAAVKARQHASMEDRRFADFIAAYVSEAVETELNGKKTGVIRDTALRTMSGAGHQHFLGSMRAFVADTTPEHLHKALFESWRYDDSLEGHTMRWDPLDDVRYALRWCNPSGDPDRKKGGSMWGANRLAIEALPLFPTAPVGTTLETTGFRLKKREGVFWTWPLWETPLTLDPLRSLVALGELQTDEPNRDRLASMGIVEVMRCQRITQGKFRNFSMTWST